MATAVIDDLRRQLREKFPQAHSSVAAALDEERQTEEPFTLSFFPPGTVSEVIGTGLGMLVAGLLVDGGDRFNPASFTEEACSRLVWVRCSTAARMLKAVDLLVRDGNIPFILLDTCGIPARELGTIPASAWWRLKLAAETSGSRLVVMSAVPRVPCAGVRVSLDNRLRPADFDKPRHELIARMRVVPERMRRAT